MSGQIPTYSKAQREQIDAPHALTLVGHLVVVNLMIGIAIWIVGKSLGLTLIAIGLVLLAQAELIRVVRGWVRYNYRHGLV